MIHSLTGKPGLLAQGWLLLRNQESWLLQRLGSFLGRSESSTAHPFRRVTEVMRAWSPILLGFEVSENPQFPEIWHCQHFFFTQGRLICKRTKRKKITVLRMLIEEGWVGSKTKEGKGKRGWYSHIIKINAYYYCAFLFFNHVQNSRKGFIA